MEPRRARALLGLAPDAAPEVVRRRYHLLARDAHPDAGGDPEEFLELQDAYAALLGAEPGTPIRPGNRRAAQNRERLAERQRERERLPHVDVSTVDWTQPLPPTPATATVEGLAVAANRRAPIAPVRLVSRGPRSLTNRVAHALEDSLVATLEIGVDLGEGRRGLRASGSGRRGKRMLALLHAEPMWQMVRRNSDVVAASRTIPTNDDPRVTALLHAAVAKELLDALDWPLARWRMVGPLD